MMMRSAPAASAHLAEIPVPAPAPTMGVPAALFSRHRFRHADRSIVLLLPSPCLDPKATIRLLIPHSKRKSWTRRDRPTPKRENIANSNFAENYLQSAHNHSMTALHLKHKGNPFGTNAGARGQVRSNVRGEQPTVNSRIFIALRATSMLSGSYGFWPQKHEKCTRNSFTETTLPIKSTPRGLYSGHHPVSCCTGGT